MIKRITADRVSYEPQKEGDDKNKSITLREDNVDEVLEMLNFKGEIE